MKKECGDISYINPQILFNLLVLPAHAHIRLKQIFASPQPRAARASCGSPRPAGAAAAPPRSPRSSAGWRLGEAGAPPRPPSGDTSPRTPVLTHSVCTGFRLPPAPRGSRFLLKPAPICERLTNLHSLHLQKRTKDRILYAVAPDGEIAVP